jgi:hypothetical protein
VVRAPEPVLLLLRLSRSLEYRADLVSSLTYTEFLEALCRYVLRVQHWSTSLSVPYVVSVGVWMSCCSCRSRSAVIPPLFY